ARCRQHLVERVVRGCLDRAAGALQRAVTLAAAVVWRAFRVAGGGSELRERDAEDFAGDHRQRRPAAGPDIRRRIVDVRGAVEIDLDGRAAHATAAAALRAGDADAANLRPLTAA